MRKIDIDLYGAPGAGKTLLLTAIYKHSERQDRKFTATSAVLYQLELIAERKPLKMTESTREERVTIETKDVTLQFVSHRGESMLLENRALDPKPLISNFRKSPSRIFVGVVNPYISNNDVAWKAVRSLIATLQSRLSLNFEQAVLIAFETLLHIDRPIDRSQAESPTERRFDPTLAELIAGQAKDILVTYDHTKPRVEDRFEWQKASDEVINRTKAELKRAVDQEVDRQKPFRDTLRSAFREIDNSMLVLTHIDLNALMPAIDSSDFDPICDDLFESRDRKVSQQLLAAMVSNEVKREGIVPWDILPEFPRRFVRYVLSLVPPRLLTVWPLQRDYSPLYLMRVSLSITGLSAVLCAILLEWTFLMLIPLVFVSAALATGGLAAISMERKTRV